MKTHISKSIFATLCFALVAVAGYMSYQQNQENMLAQEQELVLVDESVEALTACEATLDGGVFGKLVIICNGETGRCGLKYEGNVVLECSGQLLSWSATRTLKKKDTIEVF